MCYEKVYNSYCSNLDHERYDMVLTGSILYVVHEIIPLSIE